MQLSFDSFALKPFTRSLLCLSKYGEELSIYATPDVFSLSCTNSSKSAYCRFRYNKDFFSKYRLGSGNKANAAIEELPHVTGQLATRSLLSILKHKTVESTLERCEISIIDGVLNSKSASDPDIGEGDVDIDSLESRLVVRLHCKHGVIKTHKLNLNIPTSLLAPGVPETLNESFLTIGSRTIKGMLELFPFVKNAKSDPQLVWTFGEVEVVISSLESSLDSKGQAQLNTEMGISVDEFNPYSLYAAPTTIAFHLKEFNATIAFAHASNLPIDIRFTDPTAPLFIELEGDSFETLFVISTNQVQTSTSETKLVREGSAPVRKRLRDETPAGETPRFKKPMKVVQATDRASMARDASMTRETPMSMSHSRLSVSQQSLSPLPTIPPPQLSNGRYENSLRVSTPLSDTWAHQPLSATTARNHLESENQHNHSQDPLFLPSSSQLSIMDEDALRESGLGIEKMTAEEFDAMMEDEGEEVDTDMRASDHFVDNQIDEVDELMALQPTQGNGINESKAFYPLFED
ncbi:hypothetical protein K435DRAFT_964605 [Dendrothele bispora CBS 962.96]|uniref:Rad9-domain-containing protein n=1 Tax=Dendrothele bispora (strain CBS 962.96) TaxID=1314807 RepID=A0A4S8M9S4_DENBC|nr:hypothetical protein K435DRAFT_964605 [Dendrothele bispora CBS 962.96]